MKKIVIGSKNQLKIDAAVVDGFRGLLTGDVIVRRGYDTEACVLAWIPFKNPMLY